MNLNEFENLLLLKNVLVILKYGIGVIYESDVLKIFEWLMNVC